MGIPKLFYWLNERYPSLLQTVDGECVYPVDNFYIDMNGVIHAVTHGASDTVYYKDDVEMFKKVGVYIDYLVKTVHPRCLLYLAIDGVAPFAKMNQQRHRRFRVSTAVGAEPPSGMKLFNSNCISPGTEFMEKLNDYLIYFILMKIKTDPVWRGFQVNYSSSKVPGEGEHKIMSFIRSQTSNKDYSPQTTHCMHGLDADLIMLGLGTRLPYFSLLREIDSQKNSMSNGSSVDFARPVFNILYLSLLRESINVEFSCLKDVIKFPYDINKIVVDWVFLAFLVGNDFLPTIPFLHINHNALPLLWTSYKKVLPQLDGYLVENNDLQDDRFLVFLRKLKEYEMHHFSIIISDRDWLTKKSGNNNALPESFISTPFIVTCEGDIDEMVLENTDLDYLDDKTMTETKGVKKMKSRILDSIDDDQRGAKSPESRCGGIAVSDLNEKMKHLHVWSREQLAEFAKFRSQYYATKLKFNEEDIKDYEICLEYIRGLHWVIRYYLEMVPSWRWCYPYHYAPFASDICGCISGTKFEFQTDTPFDALVQLSCILPASNRDLLPNNIRKKLCSEKSELVDFFPSKFNHDLNGKLQDYESVVLIPFPDMNRVVVALEPIISKLPPSEIDRNSVDKNYVFEFSPGALHEASVKLLSDKEFPLVANVPVRVVKKPEVNYIPPAFMKHAPLDFIYPSFEHLSVEGSLKERKSRFRNFTVLQLSIKKKEMTIVSAVKLCSEFTFANWPFSYRCLVEEITDFEFKYSFIRDDTGQKKKITIEKNKLTGAELFLCQKSLEMFNIRYEKERGIVMPCIKYLVKTRFHRGYSLNFFKGGVVSVSDNWAPEHQYLPFELIHSAPKNYKCNVGRKLSVSDVYKKNDVVLCTSPTLFCRTAVVKKVNVDAMTVDVDVMDDSELDISDLPFLKEKLYHTFVCSDSAANICNITPGLLGRVSGSLNVKYCDNNRLGKFQFVNIGLNLRRSNCSLETIGYTKCSGGNYFYSNDAVTLIRNYLNRFPSLIAIFDTLYTNKMVVDISTIHKIDQSFSIADVQSWLYSSGVPGLCRCFNSSFIDNDFLYQLETHYSNKYVDRSTRHSQTLSLCQIYKPCSTLGDCYKNLSPVHSLLDSVVCTKTALCSAPFMGRGVIVGLFKKINTDVLNGQDVVAAGVDYAEVMFFSEFDHGMTMRGRSNRFMCVPLEWLMNVTQGSSSKKSVLSSSWSDVLASGFVCSENMAEWRTRGPNTWSVPKSASSNPNSAISKEFVNVVHRIANSPPPNDRLKDFFPDTSGLPSLTINADLKLSGNNLVEHLKAFCIERSLPAVELETCPLGDSKFISSVKVGGRCILGPRSDTQENALQAAAYVAYFALYSDWYYGRCGRSSGVACPISPVKVVEKSFGSSNRHLPTPLKGRQMCPTSQPPALVTVTSLTPLKLLTKTKKTSPK